MRHVCMIAYTEYAGDARVRREAETLAAAGFKVRCLALRIGDRPTRFTLDGVEVCELGEAKYQGKRPRSYMASYLRFMLSATAECARLLVRRELDIVHAHNMPDFLVFAGLLPRLAGRKVVLDVHDSMPETFAAKFAGEGWLYRALCVEERLSAGVAHRVICVNHPQRDVLVARGIPDNKTFISMNVPDPRIFGEPSERTQRDEAQLNLIYHGTMARRLGVDLLIHAVSRLRARIPSIKLNLWGHGDDIASFQALSRELGVEEAVQFQVPGYPLRELPGRLATMDVGVVGNRRSSAGDLMLPVKLLEYVSLGIPTVVPRLRAIEHYFTDDMVSYYEPENIDSLADAIATLHESVARRRQQAEHARTFLTSFGWERQGQELVRMYQGLVEN